MHIRPLFEEIAVAIEDLDAVVLAVADDDAPALIHPDVVQQGELAGAGALLAPRVQQLAVGAELVDAVAAVAVGDEHVAVGRDGEAGGHVEGHALEGRRRRELFAERADGLAAGGVLGGDVEVAVNEPDIVVGAM